MRVIEHLEQCGATIELRYRSTDQKWFCDINGFSCTAHTAAVATCRAALEAVFGSAVRTGHPHRGADSGKKSAAGGVEA